jgi:hypothetical protein
LYSTNVGPGNGILFNVSFSSELVALPIEFSLSLMEVPSEVWRFEGYIESGGVARCADGILGEAFRLIVSVLELDNGQSPESSDPVSFPIENTDFRAFFSGRRRFFGRESGSSSSLETESGRTLVSECLTLDSFFLALSKLHHDI